MVVKNDMHRSNCVTPKLLTNISEFWIFTDKFAIKNKTWQEIYGQIPIDPLDNYLRLRDN